MSKLLSLSVCLILLGVGCSNSNTQNSRTSEYPDSVVKKVVVDESNGGRQEKLEERLRSLENNFIQNRFVPSTTALYGDRFSTSPYPVYGDFNMYDESSRDCISVYSRNTNGGDLLSSLRGDDDLRKIVPLQVFSKEYIGKLKEQVNQYTQKNYSKDMYAFHVCNVGKNIDAVVGNVWSSTNSPYRIEEYAVKVADEFWKDAIAVLVYNNTVTELKDVQIFGANATGGETGPCDATLNQNNTIEWKCFAGLSEDPNTRTTYGTYKHWTLSLDGTILKAWETRD